MTGPRGEFWHRFRLAATPCGVLLVLAAGAARGAAFAEHPTALDRAAVPRQDPPGSGSTARDAAAGSGRWSGRADFNLALSSGNSGSRSLGVSAEATREIGWFDLGLNGGLLQASTARTTRQAIGTADSFEIRDRTDRQDAADRTHLRARLSRSPPASNGRQLSFYTAAGWDRDIPAGVRARYELSLGVAGIWGPKRPDGHAPLEVGAGLSYTHQRDDVEDPEVGRGSVGLRLDARSESTVGSADLVVQSASTWNLRRRDDLRLDVTGSLAFPLSAWLAFRTSAQTLLDTHPSLVRVPLVAALSGELRGTVTVPRRRLDLILLAAFAVRW